MKINLDGDAVRLAQRNPGIDLHVSLLFHVFINDDCQFVCVFLFIFTLMIFVWILLLLGRICPLIRLPVLIYDYLLLAHQILGFSNLPEDVELRCFSQIESPRQILHDIILHVYFDVLIGFIPDRALIS